MTTILRKTIINTTNNTNNPQYELDLDFSLKILFAAEFGLKDLDLLETISTGVFGRTRLVRSLRDKKFYSLKIMKKSKIVKQMQLNHVKNEIKILSRIRCTFVINLYAVFQDENNIYLLLDYISGGELFSYLRREKKFDVALAQFYLIEICCAIYHLHQFKIIYRDLKPENILINKLGHIRIQEFSLAKIIQDRTFTLCGTPEYISPEIVLGQGYGLSSDWWSIGILLHEMLLGYPPFYGNNPFAVYRKILSGSYSIDDNKIPKAAKSAISGFLTVDRVSRLGSNNFDQIKNHSFFKGIDWNSAFQELIVPPIIPTVSTEGDSSNYDFYPEETMEEPANLTLDERNLFKTIDEILDRASNS